jgi:hypothetical protein
MYYQNTRRFRPDRINTIQRGGDLLVTLESAKNYIRARMEGDNDSIQAMLLAIQRNVERYAGIRIDTGTFDAYYSATANELDLTDIPATVVSAHYLNDQGVETQMVLNSDYIILQKASPTIVILEGSYYFRLFSNLVRPVQFRVRYTAGHADLGEVWPEVRLAIESQLGFYYKNRNDGDQQQIVLSGDLTLQAKALLDPIRLRR